jgi:rubrerythrin
VTQTKARARTRKPAYIDLLNTICSQEGRAGVFLNAWAGKTPDPDLKKCLSFVAAREDSHYHIFKRRIQELGYQLKETPDPLAAERLAVTGSDVSDAEKIRWLKEAGAKQPKPTVQNRYEAAIDDESVDPLTRSLLRWFADVEADSRGLIGEVYAKFQPSS